MSETAILIPVVAALFAITMALVGVVWGTLKERSFANEKAIASLIDQNKEQEVAIGRLTERALAREQAHGEHREHTADQFARLESAINTMNGKLDQLIRGGRTPYPGSYGGRGDKPEERR